MKIDKLDSLFHLLAPDKKGNTAKAGGGNFQRILEEIQANQTGGNQKITESDSAFKAAEISEGPLGAYAFPPAVGLADSPPARAPLIQAADYTLEDLEKYQKALADPEVSLKNLYPLLQSLSSKINEMSESAEKLPANDPLKKILGEIGVLAAVEVERFNRGEYVS